MYATLDRKNRKARKQHRCDYCGGIIEKGETYDWSKHVYDGDLYEWKTHQKCQFLAAELWDYADPDEGMDEDMFQEALHDFCRIFVCPDCPKWDKEYEDCEEDESYCTDRAYEFLQTHELYRESRSIMGEIWKCRPRKERSEG